MTQWLSIFFDLIVKTAPACQKQKRRQTHRLSTPVFSSCYQDPNAFLVESVLRACLAALKFRNSNPDPLPLVLCAFRAALKSVFKASFWGHAPGAKISEILLSRTSLKIFRKFYDREHAYRNFRKFYYRELVPLKLTKFPKSQYLQFS